VVEFAQGADQVQKGAFVYFAYGSNMLAERLQKRCPSARPLGNAMARGFSLSFSKRSKDGSGKATLVETDVNEEAVYGVLFEVSQSEQTNLDKAEGRRKGYYRDDAFMVVRLTDGKQTTASVYLASPHECDASLVPYDWYHALIVGGAFQHGLPETYVAELRRTIVQPDPEPQRASRQEALKVLAYAGFSRLSPQHR
jgi:hypothetical protein